jgi:hypothetical protein
MMLEGIGQGREVRAVDESVVETAIEWLAGRGAARPRRAEEDAAE